MFWIGGNLSNLELLSIYSHVKVGHKVVLWTYNDIDNIPKEVLIKDANNILNHKEIFCYKLGDGKGSYSACSNLFRYKLLLEQGGWWSDIDLVALKPFSFNQEYVFASEIDRKGFCVPTSCVIKVIKNSEVMKFCWENSYKIDRETLQWGTIGPKMLSKAIFEHNLENYVQPSFIFCPIHFFISEKPRIRKLRIAIWLLCCSFVE